MKTPTRLPAFLLIAAAAAIVFVSTPVAADDAVNSAGPSLTVGERSGGIRLLDRNYDNNRATPQPVVPPDKDPKPGRLHSAENNPAGDLNGSGGMGSAILGGGGAMSTKAQIVERSLRATADKLR